MDESPPDEELKIWCAVRVDIEMPRGKLGTQCGHGYCGALVAAMARDPELAREYLTVAQPKITVQAKNEAALERVYAEAVAAGIDCALITDAGRTVFAEPTRTVCAFGPARRSELPRYLRSLRMLADD